MKLEGIDTATRSWSDRLAALLPTEECGGALRLPLSYQERFTPAEAAAHLSRIRELEQTPDCGLSLTFLEAADSVVHAESRAVAVSLQPLVLMSILPIFGDLGFDLVAEHPFTLPVDGERQAYVYEFILNSRTAGCELNADVADRIAQTFEAAYLGRTESDRLHRLVAKTGMTWQQILVLRAYAAYLQQSGWTFSPDYVLSVIAEHPVIAESLWHLFEARHRVPRSQDDTAAAALTQSVAQQIDEVASIDADRILRMLLDAVAATLRTNAYRRLFADEGWTTGSALSFKFNPAAIRGLPRPVPALEMWVDGPTVKGTHLRFGLTARGGIRWTDRPADFRTEVLGLVRAQMVKNAMIVPTGAKGVFYPRSLDASAAPEVRVAQARSAYEIFIGGLLDLIDDLCKDDHGHYYVVPPEATVRHDADDTYLVVAADKGTAQFSDTANAVALSRTYWLGDAFASGGSNGYDHKAMGITACGAWESVRQHLFELGIDADGDPVTAVGIGDMSGDVFGNGMLRSRSLRLIAAFDHRHIFIDPTPDAAAAFQERRRLYELPRSSWADYREDLLSLGGGVYSRKAKQISLHPAARHALGLDADVEHYTPDELIRAVLSAPVDLLFNGGIGTYVRAEVESNADVGDSANDAVRVTSDRLRVSVVGEGGNLGLTPMARRQAALHGVRLNTDAVDNAAGVDTSDHEVNIKIALKDAVAAGLLSSGARNQLLQALTDDVAVRVLAHSRAQNNALSVARAEAIEMAPVHRRILAALEATGLLHRDVESMPSDAELGQRIAAGGALTSPELGTLLAYAKLDLKAAILNTGIPDESWARRMGRTYFPKQVTEVCGDRLDDHPLAREIVATVITNHLVDDNGITFLHRLREETGASTAAIVRAWAVARHCTGQEGFLDEIRCLPHTADMNTRIDMQLKHRRLVERAARWILATRRRGFDVDVVVAEFEPPMAALRAELASFLVGADRHAAESRVRRYDEQRHLPRTVAQRCGSLFEEFSLFPICDIARQRQTDPHAAARVYFAVAGGLRLDGVLRRIAALHRSDNWDAMSRAVLRDDLYAAVSEITYTLLRAGINGADVDRVLEDASGADWLDNLLTAALDPAREPDLPILLVAVEAAKSFAASLDPTAAAATC